MENGTVRFTTLFALLVLALTAAGVPAMADSFDVSLNTSSLSGTQILAFGLVNGGGGVNNTVTLSDFVFGGGNPVPPANYLGTPGVSGDLSGTVSMDDSGGTALFDEEFNPGSTISFVLTTTNNFAGVTPDAFSMYVCDTSLNCTSDDPSGAGEVLMLNLTGGTLSPSSFALYPASAQGLPAPVVTTETKGVPEPSGILLLGLGIVALALCSGAVRGAGRESRGRPSPFATSTVQ